VENARISFDVNFRPALWTDDAGSTLQRLANAADLVFVGRDEAETLWGVSELASIRRLLPDPEVIVVKDGPVGASAMTVDGTTVFEPALRVELVEPVGAGDAFAAGYLSASLRGLDLPQRLRMGHLVAAHALAVTADHTTLPGRAWFDERLAATAPEWSAMTFPPACADR
jgi:2-dehydro-3-deoxygluconokinase